MNAFLCPLCSKPLAIPVNSAGKFIRCSMCNGVFGFATPVEAPVQGVIAEKREMPPEPESTVQCYDCRYQYPVSATLTRTIKVGESAGIFSGSGVTSGGGFGVGGGSTSATHYAKVDLCLPCAALRSDREWWEQAKMIVIGGGIVLAILFGIVSSSWPVGLLVLVAAIVIGVIIENKQKSLPALGEPGRQLKAKQKLPR